MKKQSIVMFAALLTSCSLSFGATLNSIGKDQVQQAFVDKTFTSVSISHLNDKTINNTFTGYMDAHGKIWGIFAHKPANAPQIDEGTYSIKDDGLLCLTWKHWRHGKEFCDYVYNTDNAYVIVSNNNIFHTVFMKSAIKSGKQLKF